jgi:uncharacterized RDD family membrane protein YckC
MQEEENRDTENEVEELYEIAGPMKRLFNYLIDNSIVSLLTVGLTKTLESAKVIMPPNENDITFYYPYVVGVLVGYYIIMETIFSKTIGKIFTSCEVISLEGEKPFFSAIFLRTGCRLIPLYGISLLIPNMVALHDYLSRTRVVVKVQ